MIFNLGVAWADAVNETPAAFLRYVYAPYVANTDSDGRIVDQSVFTPELWYLIQRDENRTPGDAGYLDDDPFCACQDHYALTDLCLRVGSRTPTTARIGVSFTDGTDRQRIGFLLVVTQVGWRIADIADPGRPSLFAMLRSHP